MYSLEDLCQRYRTHELKLSGGRLSKASEAVSLRTGAWDLSCPGTFCHDWLFFFCSYIAENFDLENQEAEENFDLALISSLEIDLVPHLGGLRVPDYLIGQLSKVLHQGSQLFKFPFHTPRSGSPGLGEWNNVGSSRNSREDFEQLDLESVGSTATAEVAPRERFSYWCFDLLFLISSNMTSGAYLVF
jgi:hypothetical protein